MNANHTASRKIKAHKQYSASDYARLNGKGYTDAEILKIWDRDQAEGALPVGSSFTDEELVKFYTQKTENNNVSRKIKEHKNYSETDYAHLHNKGYTDAEIIEIWNRD